MTGLSGVAPAMTAGQLVNDAWASWKTDASDLAAASVGFLTDISTVNVTPIDTSNVVLDVSGIEIPTSFKFPVSPTVGEMSPVTLDVPASPTITVEPLEIESAPALDVELPTLSYEAAPVLDVAAPNTTVSLVYPDAPKAPTLDYPGAPTNTLGNPPTVPSVNVPNISTVTMPTWAGVAPPTSISVPDISISYEDEVYSSALVDELQRMTEGVGIPDSTWNAIFSRSVEELSVEKNARLAKATDEWASRGFFLESGVLDRKLNDVRAETFLAISGLSRDQAIERSKAEVENLRFTVQQSIVLEGSLIDSFDKSRERLISIQELNLKAAVAVSEVQVATLNAKLNAYKTEAEVFETVVKAKVAQLEQYRVIIEAEKLKVQAGSLSIEAYNASLKSIALNVDIYSKSVDAVVSKISAYGQEVAARKNLIEGERMKIEAANLEISGYSEQVKAYRERAQAISITNENNKIKAGAYESLVKAYEAEVGAYKTEVDAKVSASAQLNTVNDFALRGYASTLEGIKVQASQDSERIRALVSKYQTDANVYSSSGSVLSSFKQAEISQYQAQIGVAAENAKLAASKASLDVEQVLRIASLEAENAKVAAQVYGQVGAATLAGVSMRAGLDESTNWSNQYQESHIHNYQE